MSNSPPIRRLSTAASSREELINAYEAEEERIINVLSRKLEQLRQDKIGLENVLEAESESHVNRLSRELSALRIAQQQLQAQHQNGASSSANNGATPGSAGSTGMFSISPETRIGVQHLASRSNPLEPSPEVMLEAMRRENEQLRNRLTDTEREFVRITRLNDIYREELIEHRTRMHIPVEDLIGMPTSDPLSQPTHRRAWSGSSPSTSAYQAPALTRPQPSNGVPIPRPPSQIHRPSGHPPADLSAPLSHSSSSSTDSPFPFSPPASSGGGADPASYMTSATNITSPPSSGSFNQITTALSMGGRALTYPSVPPPSLSSSFGSPNISYHMPLRDPSLSPIEPLSRRNSNARRGSVDRSRGASRRASLDFGARVAETGTLVPRNRGGVQGGESENASYGRSLR